MHVSEKPTVKITSFGDKCLCAVCNICTPNYCDIGWLNRNNKRELWLRNVQLHFKCNWKGKNERKKLLLNSFLIFFHVGCIFLDTGIKALLWSHSFKAEIIIFYLWATVCLLLMSASSPRVQRGSAATRGSDRKPGLTKDMGTSKHPAIPRLHNRDLGIAWGIIGTSKFTQRGRLEQGPPSLYKVTLEANT